jgi:hypothetical protein
MSLAYPHERLQLPDGLRRQLHDFRRRVWLIKMVEAGCTAAFAVVAAYLLMFLLDRAFDTPPWLRATLFVAAFVGCLRIPAALYRWVWRNRRLEQLAMLLARKHPAVGDQLLGIIELVRNDFEQARSRALCEAAVREVAKDAQSRDFSDAVPAPRHKTWVYTAAVPIVAAVALAVAFPAAARSAWARLLSPWGSAPRYTFAALENLPTRLVVPHGESFTVTAKLADGTVWHPVSGEAQIDGQSPVAATLQDGRYAFDMPSQIEPGWLTIQVGDASQRVRVEPTLRPELTSLVASVTLPDYLALPGSQRKDVRGGAISLVQGSRASFTATASRELSSAKVDGQPRKPSGASVDTPETPVKGTRKMALTWKDTFGLEGKEPFTLAINGRDDEAPSLACEDLPRQKVVLDSEMLNFKIHAQDDFGVRRVGMEWQGIDNPVVSAPAKGERMLGAGGPDKETLELAGTFSAKSLGIEPQPVQVRMFVEDYLPGRPRIYSPPYTFFVLTPEQHAIWITEQLSRWHRQAIEVRDREMQLHETNKELRALAASELDKPENRRKIETQAAAERQNGRRLTGLTNSGERLVREAMRNPEFGVGHLEKWAEMLQILKDISGNRMPSVADLLKEAAQAPSVAQANQQPNTKPSPMNNQSQGTTAQASQKPSKPSPMAGQIRASGGAPKPGEEKPGEQKDQPVIPRIADMESSQNSPLDKPLENKSAPKKPGAQPPQRLPVTTVMGKPKDTPPPPETPAEQKMDEAVRKQRDLLAEFEKIADELNRVLANLEGSTLVKRLKAAARLQYKIGGRVSDQLGDAFGVGSQQVNGGAWKVLGEMSEQEGKASHDVSLIMDDMQSYFERRQFLRFKTVLDEMRKQDVIGSLRLLGDDVKKENGLSIAQCEFWSDTLDRWAEDLVDPACNGQCEAKSRDSLPPAIILEVLQILEAEVNLREETRVAEQAKAAVKAEEHKRQALTLSTNQKGIQARTEKVTQQIRELPDGEEQFPKEIALLTRVAEVMGEAAEILDRPETGSPAIGAETEAIELLLMSKRINPKGGGGGGASPGGGGKGSTVDSAMALLGGGANEKEVREDRGVSQASGESGPSLPEEYRAGLDEYFNRLEKGAPGR